MKTFFRQNFFSEYFLILLPVFFVFHGYIDNLQATSVRDALLLVGEYLLISLLVFGNFFLIFNSRRKAALFTFCLLFFHLFFGATHDAIKKWQPDSFIVQYSFILPTAAVFFVFVFFYLQRSKKTFATTTNYLNALLLLLILFDVPRLIKAANKQVPIKALAGAVACKTCARPDVYLIIADEYADSTSLQNVFNFNNGGFQNELRKRGFHINHSKSNYNFTPFAMASLLQMNYLTGIEGHNGSLADKNRCYDLINTSSLWNFFESNGYTLKNYSIFNLANLPTQAPQNYILIGTDNIVTQTFLSRMNRDIRYHLATSFQLQSEVNRVTYFMNRCNQRLLSGLLQETAKQEKDPRFIYAHITMPHYPYYFGEHGEPNAPESLVEGKQNNKPAYINYLKYANNIYLAALDSILASSKTPPIILFMGDHGFREFDDGFEKNAPFYYMNLNAVYLPDGHYEKFYDGISSVNQLRVLLNTSFGQQLPLLKDSSILLHE